MVLWNVTPNNLQKCAILEETAATVYSVDIYTKITIALLLLLSLLLLFSVFSYSSLSFSLLSSFSS
jgi:hypothetical protein